LMRFLTVRINKAEFKEIEVPSSGPGVPACKTDWILLTEVSVLILGKEIVSGL
jgi:hypothetical protein